MLSGSDLQLAKSVLRPTDYAGAICVMRDDRLLSLFFFQNQNISAVCKPVTDVKVLMLNYIRRVYAELQRLLTIQTCFMARRVGQRNMNYA